ncbi:ABC transporter permease [Phosphitispora sp. TUW77]|uniref:ABC transporter permease n=1 Tax=Phosphitispora sp. TUW77 TaxID=3152361 RepID=UPI003AB10B40
MTGNPVLTKELRDRVRTWRSPLVITVYLGFIAVVGGFFIFEQTRGGMGGPRVYRMGIEIFNIMAILQIGLIAFLTPGLTAGVISGERERQTLPLLMITRMSPLSVATGKLISAISYMLLLIVISMPFYSIVFFFGGVSLSQFFQVAGILMVTTVLLGSMGMFFSSLFKRTTVAIIVTYGATFMLFFGTVFLTALIVQITQYYIGGPVTGPQSVPFIIYFNPLVALGSVLPMGGNIVPFSSSNLPIQSLAPWQVSLLLDTVITLLAVGLTVWLIRPTRAGSKRRG